MTKILIEEAALKLAREALEWNMDYLPSQGRGTSMARDAITVAKQALAQPAPVQEPVEMTFDEAWASLSWQEWRTKSPKELFAELHRLTTKPAPVPHPVIAGVLFDFMGRLTSREARLTLSSTDDASPAVEAITEFAKMRGLSLDDARVQDWQDGIAKGGAA